MLLILIDTAKILTTKFPRFFHGISRLYERNLRVIFFENIVLTGHFMMINWWLMNVSFPTFVSDFIKWGKKKYKRNEFFLAFEG